MNQGNPKSAMAARQSAQSPAATPAPTPANYLKVLTVEEYEGANGKAARRWTQVGVAFPHKEGTGFNVELRCLPLNGRLVILPADADDGASR